MKRSAGMLLRRGFQMGKRTIDFVILIGAVTLALPAAFAQLPSIQPGFVTIELQDIATGLNAPLEMAYPNDGSNRLFIVEQGGRIKLYKNGAVQGTLFLDVSGRIGGLGGERGLLGLAFHPGFSNPNSVGFKKLYTYNSEPSNSGTPDFAVPMGAAADNHSVIAEWQVATVTADVVDVSTRRELLRVGHPQSNHNGGEISFRPSDGWLYIGFGDGGNGNDVGPGHTTNVGNGQDTTNLLGDILRIDPISPTLTTGSPNPQSANAKYRIPADNPFVGAIAGADEIFAYGFRNPYRFSFDTVNDRLVVGDVGQNNIEEVDIVDRGKNYGWNKKEGTFLFDPSNGNISTDPNPDPNPINPVAEYDHGDGNSVIGGFVYRGTQVSALIGKYVFGDYSGRLFYCDLSTGQIRELRLGVTSRALGAQLKGFGEDPSGEIYAITDTGGTTGGKVQKIVPVAQTTTLYTLSTRGFVGTNANVLIGGVIFHASTPQSVLVRALGPSLSSFNVPGVLANPTVTVYNEAGTPIASNDNWQARLLNQTGAGNRDAPFKKQ